jgi:hypothetical protein
MQQTEQKTMEAVPEYLTIESELGKFLVNRNAVKFALWHRIPEGFRDPQSEEAQKSDVQLMRVAAKAMLRAILPNILKRMFGENAPQIPPRTDLIQWTLNLLINGLVDYAALKEWRMNIEPCDSCESRIYKVLSISSLPDTTSTEK